MPGTVDADLRQASVLLMPSRGEGFGLVGLEAISVGTPVLVSSRSGLAELINEFGPPESRQFIVEVDDSGDQDVQRWKSALEGVLNDREQALSRTLHLWDWLNNKTSWLKLGARLGAETKRIRRVD
jgi:glycosyltransferase involved in cell wall biosynthesis